MSVDTIVSYNKLTAWLKTKTNSYWSEMANKLLEDLAKGVYTPDPGVINVYPGSIIGAQTGTNTEKRAGKPAQTTRYIAAMVFWQEHGPKAWIQQFRADTLSCQTREDADTCLTAIRRKYGPLLIEARIIEFAYATPPEQDWMK